MPVNIELKDLKLLQEDIKKSSEAIIEKMNTNADNINVHGAVLDQLIHDVKLQGEVLETIIAKLQ